MSTAGCQTISIEELKSELFSPRPVKIVDVREVEEYRAGHIEGSMLIPLGILPHRVDELNQQEDVVLVCRSGNRSEQACNILRERGFHRVRSLSGGLSAWR
jgi:rhodanese-related sulfurtransferase